jgi:hypothetical protein
VWGPGQANLTTLVLGGFEITETYPCMPCGICFKESEMGQ